MRALITADPAPAETEGACEGLHQAPLRISSEPVGLLWRRMRRPGASEGEHVALSGPVQGQERQTGFGAVRNQSHTPAARVSIRG